MKKILMVSVLICIAVGYSFNTNDDNPKKNFPVSFSASVDTKKMDVNSISTFYRTNGAFNRDPATGNGGFEWPKGSGKIARYASGIWLGCVSGNDTLTAVAEFSYDYQSGFVDESGNPQTDSTYRIYVINKNEINSYDYLHWPGNQGAYKTSDGKPSLIGDQTMFYVYTDGFPHGSGSTSDSSLNAQILQTNWAYTQRQVSIGYPADPFTNTIFMEYRIINRSNRQWNNMWIGLWSDDDLGDATDDKIGCDTNLNIGYTFNSDNNDGIYGSAPPAVGMKLLRGSLKYTGNMNDTVKFFQPFGSNNIVSKVGYKDAGITTFIYYNSSSPEPADPRTNIETYRVLKGWTRQGQRWINPFTHDTTNLVYSGDPVTGTGWLMPGEGDRRSITGTGPFYDVNPGDTITIVAAQIIAKGNSNFNSITQLRNTAKTITNFYNSNNAAKPEAYSPRINSYAPGNGKINLTWSDSAIQFTYNNFLTGGSYKFQGYNIYQIKSHSANPSANDTILIKTFDIIDGIKNIFDSIYVFQHDGIFYGVVQKGYDNGLSTYFETEKDTIDNYTFVNGVEYKFAVTAYYYDSTGGLFTFPKVLESSKSNIIKVIPQSITAGTQINYDPGDTIYTDQRDLAVVPVIYDPLKLVNASYTSTFGGNIANPNWTVTKTFNGVTSILFENVYNFTGEQDSVRKADGLLFIHKFLHDSGIVHDPDDLYIDMYNSREQNTRERAWTYTPSGREWFSAPDTLAVTRATQYSGRIIKRQFQSRSLGMSFPSTLSFRNLSSRVKANGNYFTPESAGSPVLNGGPLRKIKIVFGQSQMAYRYKPTTGNVLLTDTNLTNTPFADFTTIPFSVFAIDELDSSNGAARQLNVAFIDADNDGSWSPDTTGLGKFQLTYILASDYSSTPYARYTSKNPGIGTSTNGFGSMDIMYTWLPRIKNVNGVAAHWNDGDVLTISPYRITRPDFVPGYPVKYKWNVEGTTFGNTQAASADVNSIKVFPNPYYGFSALELNDEGDRFIYFSHLPQACTIYIYTLNGMLVNKINRNENDPTKTLEKWNLQNQSGSYVASGMYLVYVDCNNLGTKILKLAVFTR